MIPSAEDKLLIAVRDRLRSQLSLQDRHCQIEYDEVFPATSGDRFLVVSPGGVTPDRRHLTSGGVNALVYSVDVTAVRRLGRVPRDQRRDVFAFNLNSLNDLLGKVYNAIDWVYDVTAAANAAMSLSSDGFVHPLVFNGVDAKPRTIASPDFASTGEGDVALARTIRFSNALFVTSK